MAENTTEIKPAEATSIVGYGDYSPLDKTQYQFMRVYELIIGDGKTKKGFSIADLEVSFSIKKSANNKDAQNTADISITNLSEETLAILEKDYPVVSLKVGYLKTGLKELFSGEVYDMETKRNGTDRVTTLKCTPFQSKLSFNYVSDFIAAGNTVGSAIEKIRQSVDGLAKGIYRSDKLNLTLPFGMPIAGSAMQELQRICNAYLLEYRLDNGALYISDIDGTSDSSVKKAPVLSYTTGLLAGPYKSTGRIKRGKLDPLRKEGLTVKALLNPIVQAGWAVVLEGTGDTDGTYKVEEVTFNGSYRGSDWTMDILLMTTNEFAKMRAEDKRKADKKKNRTKKEETK